VFGVRGCIGKNSSPTLVRHQANIEYISEGQPSSYELTFGVELDLNPHSKMISETILDPFKGSCTKPKSVGCEGVY